MPASWRQRLPGILIGFLFALYAVVPAGAEVFHLSTGGTIEGKLINTLAQPTRRYVIKTATGKIILETSRVVRIEQKSDVLKQYEEAFPSVSNTVDGHFKMALTCAKLKLLVQRDYHLEHVLKLEPDHERARQLLGYTRQGDGWQKADLWMREQGYVKIAGRWRIPQEVESDRLREQRSEEEKNWRELIRRWETAVVKNRPNAAESWQNLKGIDAYRATPALADRLSDLRQAPRRDLRLLYVDLLSKIGGTVASNTLMKRVMEDPDELVRERCVEQLRRWKSTRAMHYFIEKLSSKDNTVVNRAGAALGSLGNPDAVLPLIDALVTSHQFQVGSGGNLNAGFSPDGGVGFGAGGKPKIIRQDFSNRDVHAALSQLVSANVNFAYNEEGWRNWYMHINTPAGVNLRRRR